MKKGLFITLEGIDFSGKTTQARYLISLLKKNQLDYLFLREPGGTKMSERIRRILLSKGEIDICPKSELWLYQAARSQVVAERIMPALKQGLIVVCDRFYDSTTAYQVYGRGLDKNFIQKANLFAADGLEPDLTILFDLPEKLAFERKRSLNRVKDRLENEKLTFFKKVRRGYLNLAKNEKRRIKIVDASQSKPEVRQEMTSVVVKFLKSRGIKVLK
jgi:dTMP kinase